MATLGERIKTRREACGMSLAELACVSHVSRGYLYQLERDESSPTIDVALKLAAALGITVNALAYDENMPEDVVVMRQRLDAIAMLANGPNVEKGAGDENGA